MKRLSAAIVVAFVVWVALGADEGVELIGTRAPDWSNDRWVQGGPLRLSDLRGRVVLLRFFMEADCPHCRATAPALNDLYREFGPKGLVVVGMYTPKPAPRPATIEEVRRHVEAYGFSFPVAIDDSWDTLRRLWLDRVRNASFTSASLLIDREGIVRHVHPGGAYAKGSADYEAMRAAIASLLADR